MRTGSLIYVYRATKIEHFKEILIEKTPESDYRPKINFFSFLEDEEEAKKVASDFLADSVFMKNDFELSSSLLQNSITTTTVTMYFLPLHKKSFKDIK